MCSGSAVLRKQDHLERKKRQQLFLHVYYYAACLNVQLHGACWRGTEAVGPFVTRTLARTNATQAEAHARAFTWSASWDRVNRPSAACWPTNWVGLSPTSTKTSKKAQGISIAEIFDTRGEEEFRRIEQEAVRKRVREVERGKPMVLALGGGAFVDPEESRRCSKSAASPSGWIVRSQRICAPRGRPDASAAGARSREVPAALRGPPRTLYSQGRASHRGRHRRSGRDRGADSEAPDFLAGMAASLRRQALRIFRAALKAADPVPGRAAARRVYRAERLIAGRKRYRSRNFRNIYVIGAGKASAQMARAVERLLGAAISAAAGSIRKTATRSKLRRIEVNECGHPMPDAAGCGRRAAHRADREPSRLPDDLVICLISGGASALLPLPAPPITLAEKQKTTRSAAALRRQHPRDQLRSETHLGDQGRPARAPGLAGHAAHADSFRRDRRRSGRDRLRPHGSRSLDIRGCPRDFRKISHLGTSSARRPAAHPIRSERNTQARRQDFRADANNVIVGSNRSGGGRGGARSARGSDSNPGALDVRRGRSARSGARPRRHRQGDSCLRPPDSNARLRRFRAAKPR